MFGKNKNRMIGIDQQQAQDLFINISIHGD